MKRNNCSDKKEKNRVCEKEIGKAEADIAGRTNNKYYAKIFKKEI